MRTTATTPPAQRRPADTAPAPSGRTRVPWSVGCVADATGALAFVVTEPEGLTGGRLLLRQRGTGEEVRLPFTATGPGPLRAVLPGDTPLAEGYWEVHAEPPGGEPVRLRPGLDDLRALVDRDPEGAGTIAVHLPYASKYGNLALRAWLRAPHAEAGAVHVAPGETTVRGRCYGTVPTPAAYAELRPAEGEGEPVRAEVTGEGREVRLRIAHAPLLAHGPRHWQVWLRPDGARGPEVRLARLLDDLVDRHTVFTYPATVHEGLRARPYYSGANNLAFRVTAVAPAADPAA
ncbi:hypothetical protein [Streptomyces sp. SID11385]|uniref:hypothetical protein n=1 Tax=Streptomyces sp. SID11385 TaxID=2706031 RepID=UPI0013CD560A|nr:hypothetical protein [Streptomyces sp. SID11385]NEA38246.1 hypothetical protein [Streptomyces sp. SID11385]